jgi:hypothetical protein
MLMVFNDNISVTSLWFVCSNPVHGDVYTEQNHVIKIDNALLQVGGFLGNSTNKTDHNDVTEILLEVASDILLIFTNI